MIDDNGHRADKPEYPIKAVREAILKALVHRDYSVRTENVTIRIEMYCDRMEITNSGGLFGKAKIVAFVGKSENYVMTQIVSPLVESGKLKMTIPDKPKSPNQKFVKA